MLTASKSIQLWLESQIRPGNKDLLDRVIAGGTDLELQINVSPLGGEPMEGKASSYTNGVDEWFSFRIPKGAATNQPHWTDFPLRYNMAKHVDAIGCTGWNWKKQVSQWVGFDFDSIVGHAVGVGISNTQLDEIRQAASALPYVEVRKSTGGLGLHLYVYLDNVPCQNHTEHAAIARCVLAKISEQVSMDLLQHVDACGGNMWIAARRANEENDGFGLIKAAECSFTQLPENWRDHVQVVNRSRPRVSIAGVSSKDEDVFTQLTSSHRRVTLDETHLKIRDRLAELGCAVWIQDHYLLQTHTCLLKQVHDELELKGVFETSSKGSNTREPNCFGFPLDHGVWKWYRFGQGTAEHKSWKQDGRNWTTCFYNREPTLDAAAAVTGGKLVTSGGYEYPTLEDAVKMINMLSTDGKVDIGHSDQLLNRPTVVKRSKSGELVIEVERDKRDPDTLGDWSGKSKKNHWSQTIPIQADPVEKRILDYDQQIRCLKSPGGQPAGWVVMTSDGEWTHKNAGSVKMVLQSNGHDKPEAECLMGSAETSPWRLVSIPFASEYPGDRQWNLNAPQLVYKPVAPDDDNRDTPHPHWDMILQHVGSSLDETLAQEAWAQQSGVITGRQYLQCWFASVIREPFQPLPYLFCFGPENSGKSILHEAFSLLVTRGVVKADRSLTSTSEFNGELEGCILAVVEEKNISTSPGAHNRIKDAVTSTTLSIRRMRSDSYEVPNSSHWIQCANSPDFCPVFPGDTRITMMYVPPIQKEIPKPALMKALKEEAPHFLWSLLHTTLPQARGRLRIPIVNTKFKDDAASMNKTQLELFLDENCLWSPTGRILFSEFYTKFQAALPAGEVYSKNKLSKALSIHERTKVVAGTNNVRYIEGITWGTVK